jgi:hypothetical protein
MCKYVLKFGNVEVLTCLCATGFHQAALVSIVRARGARCYARGLRHKATAAGHGIARHAAASNTARLDSTALVAIVQTKRTRSTGRFRNVCVAAGDCTCTQTTAIFVSAFFGSAALTAIIGAGLAQSADRFARK